MKKLLIFLGTALVLLSGAISYKAFACKCGCGSECSCDGTKSSTCGCGCGE